MIYRIDELEAQVLALQTQLAAAELKAKEWIDVAYEAASQKEELKRELERVETELRNIVNAKRFSKEHFEDDTAFADWVQSRARYALPSAKTAQPEQQKG